MDFSGFKRLIIDGIELKQLFINGIQVWKGVSYTNQIPISTDTDGSIYNGKGYRTGYYDNNGNVGLNTTTDLSGFIPCKIGDVVRLKNVKYDGSNSSARLTFYKPDKTYIGQVTSNSSWIMNNIFKAETDASGNYVKITINSHTATTGCGFFRISANEINSSSIITVNEEIE